MGYQQTSRNASQQALVLLTIVQFLLTSHLKDTRNPKGTLHRGCVRITVPNPGAHSSLFSESFADNIHEPPLGSQLIPNEDPYLLIDRPLDHDI